MIITLENDKENILSTNCEEVSITDKKGKLYFTEKEELDKIIIELKNTLREHKDGVGLAAPQIGINKRVFVINYGGDIRTYINPIIVKSVGFNLSEEGCLSIPCKKYLMPRAPEITVQFMTPLAITKTEKLVGVAAFVFQHELDHLDGVTIADAGLELDDKYYKASEEEKAELHEAYLNMLKEKSEELNKEIEADPELKKISDASKFLKEVQQGKVNMESRLFTEEEVKQANKKAEELKD